MNHLSHQNFYSHLLLQAINTVLYGFSPACWQSFCTKYCYFIQVLFSVLHLSFTDFSPVPQKQNFISLILPQKMSHKYHTKRCYTNIYFSYSHPGVLLNHHRCIWKVILPLCAPELSSLVTFSIKYGQNIFSFNISRLWVPKKLTTAHSMYGMDRLFWIFKLTNKRVTARVCFWEICSVSSREHLLSTSHNIIGAISKDSTFL